MKLISLIKYITELKNLWLNDDEYKDIVLLRSIFKYIEFLNQPLTLEMFVPCVDNEPFNYSKHGNKEQFEQAKERVLFKGVDPNYIYNTKGLDCSYIVENNETIECLANLWLNLELTESAIKQLK